MSWTNLGNTFGHSISRHDLELIASTTDPETENVRLHGLAKEECDPARTKNPEFSAEDRMRLVCHTSLYGEDPVELFLSDQHVLEGMRTAASTLSVPRGMLKEIDSDGEKPGCRRKGPQAKNVPSDKDTNQYWAPK